jgi:Lrp/AsnC family leucine-responsive transcriptional regulator
MDDLDRRILAALIPDARRPLSQVAEELGVAPTTLHQRVKRMEEKGVITGSRLLLDWEEVGLAVLAVVSVDVGARGLADAATALAALPSVQSCHSITGEFDLMMIVRARSSAHLGEILEEIRAFVPGRSRTGVVLNTFFDGRVPPLETEAQKQA